MEAVETIQYKGYTIEIVPDSEPTSPREWDNLGTMICWHDRYKLGDNHNYEDSEAFFAEHKLSDMFILPLYLYDHGGITMRTDAYSDKWDSGQVGYIYCDVAKAKEEFTGYTDWKKLKAKVYNLLEGEVKEYTQYLEGDVYGFRILDKNKEEVFACWGYFGIDSAREEAKSNADWYRQEADKAKQTKTKELIKNHVPLIYR